MKISERLLAMLLLTGLGPALGYEELTHGDMTERAVARSALGVNTTLLSDLGLFEYGSVPQLPAPDSPGSLLTISALVRVGALEEDAIPRPCNHFFDPEYDRAFTLLCPPNKKSPDWALEDASSITQQAYSYRDAQDAYLKAVTASDKQTRAQYWGQVFRAIGQVVHHIQDMAQPQHVRNDAHLNAFGIKVTKNWYESYAFDKTLRGQLTELTQTPPYVPSFATARTFWTNNSNSGLADFTNQNFVSEGTTFVYEGGQVSPNATYKLPAPTTSETVTLQSLGLSELCANLKADPKLQIPPGGDCVIEFIGNNVSDKYSGATSVNKRAASLSLFDSYLQDVRRKVSFVGVYGEQLSADRVLTMNRFNFDAALSHLIPRAIAYSTGLINHFFRGRLSLTRSSSGTGWTVSNPTSYTMYGTFTLYHDNSMGQRSPLADGSWQGTLQSGAVVPRAFKEPPSGTKNLVVVFTGQLGTDTQTRVATKVLAYSPPPTANVYLTVGDWGPYLDDAFDVYIDGIKVYSGGTTLASGPFGRTLTVGEHLAKIVVKSSATDSSGTWYLSEGTQSRGGTHNVSFGTSTSYQAATDHTMGSTGGAGSVKEFAMYVKANDSSQTMVIGSGGCKSTDPFSGTACYGGARGASCGYDLYMNGQLIRANIQSTPDNITYTYVTVPRSGFKFINLVNGWTNDPYAACLIRMSCDTGCGFGGAGDWDPRPINYNKPDMGVFIGAARQSASTLDSASTAPALAPVNAFRIVPQLPAQ